MPLAVEVQTLSMPGLVVVSRHCVTDPPCCDSGSGSTQPLFGLRMVGLVAPGEPVYLTVTGGGPVESVRLDRLGPRGWVGHLPGGQPVGIGDLGEVVPPPGWRWRPSRSYAEPLYVVGRLDGPAGESLEVVITR